MNKRQKSTRNRNRAANGRFVKKIKYIIEIDEEEEQIMEFKENLKMNKNKNTKLIEGKVWGDVCVWKSKMGVNFQNPELEMELKYINVSFRVFGYDWAVSLIDEDTGKHEELIKGSNNKVQYWVFSNYHEIKNRARVYIIKLMDSIQASIDPNYVSQFPGEEVDVDYDSISDGAEFNQKEKKCQHQIERRITYWCSCGGVYAHPTQQCSHCGEFVSNYLACRGDSIFAIEYKDPQVIYKIAIVKNHDKNHGKYKLVETDEIDIMYTYWGSKQELIKHMKTGSNFSRYLSFQTKHLNLLESHFKKWEKEEEEYQKKKKAKEDTDHDGISDGSEFTCYKRPEKKKLHCGSLEYHDPLTNYSVSIITEKNNIDHGKYKLIDYNQDEILFKFIGERDEFIKIMNSTRYLSFHPEHLTLLDSHFKKWEKEEEEYQKKKKAEEDTDHDSIGDGSEFNKNQPTEVEPGFTLEGTFIENVHRCAEMAASWRPEFLTDDEILAFSKKASGSQFYRIFWRKNDKNNRDVLYIPTLGE